MERSWRFRCVFSTSLAVCLLSTGALHADTATRTWTSSDGKTLQASALEIDANSQTVDLKRADGATFTLNWSRLSPADIEWLKQQVKVKSTRAKESKPTQSQSTPDTFELKDVPMVKQKGNFCVPASATMIAGFHGLKTDQDEVAQLSSEASVGNQGTYPSDMLLAMKKLGFDGKQLRWNVDNFESTALPAIQHSLLNQGPIYISFKAGVFGDMGHGCVIIGYNNRREEMIFHNPWGNVFIKSYEEVAKEGYGVVFIDPPMEAPIASASFVENIQQTLPRCDGDFMELANRLQRSGIAHELVWCSRRDSRDDPRFAKDTARSDGRKILELAFERNPAVLIPASPKGQTEAYYFVTRPPEGGASFLVREITQQGWNDPELVTLGSLTREWATEFQVPDEPKPVWELPMIELRLSE